MQQLKEWEERRRQSWLGTANICSPTSENTRDGDFDLTPATLTRSRTHLSQDSVQPIMMQGTHAGWLIKKGRMQNNAVATWKRRYCIFNPATNVLAYYTDDTRRLEKGHM
jgi:hypothetical protein